MRGNVRRQEAEEQSGEQSSSRGKRQDAPIDGNRMQVQEVSWTYREKKVRAPNRERHADSTADQRQENAFRKKLARDSPRTGSDGGAYRDLSLSRRSSRQQEARYVSAGNQQHESDGAKQDKQSRTKLARHLIAHRNDIAAPVAIE